MCGKAYFSQAYLNDTARKTVPQAWALYNGIMKMTVQEFADKFRILRGDSTASTPDNFIIEGINWCFREIPRVPKLGKIFTKHETYNLDANKHYRWNINSGFRRLIDVLMLNFYTSTGGEPCRLNLCHKDVEDFYNRNGIIELKHPGQPCQYTIEEESDDIWIVLDRPSNVPIIMDIIVAGFPKEVKTMEDEIDISAIAEQLMLQLLASIWYQESADFNFSEAIFTYMDNKAIPEAIQALNKRWTVSGQAILGEIS